MFNLESRLLLGDTDDSSEVVPDYYIIIILLVSSSFHADAIIMLNSQINVYLILIENFYNTSKNLTKRQKYFLMANFYCGTIKL